MTEPIFSEKRTRSQITLPDSIFNVPDCSPMKGARTALRNHTVSESVVSSSDKAADDESEDALLLSPGKKRLQMETTNKGKRSASPPVHDEYPSSGSPSEGRELKRLRRDDVTSKDQKSNSGSGGERSNHSRNHSEPNIALGSRQRSSATKARKPVSTHSATIERVIFSPTPTSPKKSRAQSVPLFPTFNDLPRIDLRNPPPSPKRRRSPSRSPSKEREPKLRITSLNYRLPTIEDEGNMFMDRTGDAEGSTMTPQPAAAIDEANIDVTRPKSGMDNPERPGTPSGPRQIQSSTASSEIIPASPPTAEIVPASPPPRETLPSSSAHIISEVIPASPPSLAEYTAPIRKFAIPATPATQSLNKLIPMSPLTPLPETPLPARSMTNGDTEGRYAGGIGWGIVPMKELVPTSDSLKPQAAAVASSTSQSRLPRPSTTTLPSGPFLKDSGPSTSTTRQSSVLPATTKKSLTVTQKGAATTTGSKASNSQPKDAFAMLMKRPIEKMNAKNSIFGDKSSKVMPPPQSIFAKSVGKGKEAVAAGPSSKPEKKLKEKMKPRAKALVEKPLVILPLSDEEDEDHIENADSESKTGNSADATDTDDPPADQKEVIPEPTVSVITESEDRPMANPSSNMHKDDVPMDSNRDAEVMQEDIISERNIDVEIDVIPETLQAEVPAPEPEIPAAEASAEPDFATAENAAQANAEEKSTQSNDRDMHDADVDQPTTQTAKSKHPLGKKRQHASIPAPVRVTRSVSNRKTTEMEGSQIAGPSSKKPTTTRRPQPEATKRIKKPVPAVEINEDVAIDVTQDRDDILPPGSPMRTTPSKPFKKISNTETDGGHNSDDEIDMISSVSTPTGSKLLPPSPSPTKIARSTLMAMRPTAASIARTFSSSSLHSGPNSSLSTLSNALEKLRMPAPSRPSTSMGFNRDVTDDNSTSVPLRSKDDVAIVRPSLGRSDGIQRAATLGSSAFKSTSSTTTSSKASGSRTGKLVQKPLSMFLPKKGGISKQPAVGARRMGALGNKPSIFGVGGGPRRTISKKTTLPVVIGSPVKGGGNADGEVDETMQEDNEDEEQNDEEGGKIFNAIMNGSSATQLLENLLAQGPDKGKNKEISNRAAHSSRRVSMLSRDLTQSLSTVPSPPLASSTTRGMMGPPATPPSSGRLNRNMGSGSGSSASGSPSQGPKRSARIASTAPAMKAKASNDGSVAAGKKAAAEPLNPAKKILKDCVIFVDVKSEDGDEAGSLFIEMLEGVGARVLTRVGQTCTHIVFKNGLMSTITRYKLLRDPKPLVVGIGWVVECIEQRKKVDEKDFLVDLERTNIAGTHKRRRSMLPRLFAEEEQDEDETGDGDHSMDGSVSSVTMDDDLTPLERARRRKSILTGPPP